MAEGKIYSAITAIMAEIGAIGKDRKNQQQGYAYRGIEDFYNTLHPLMVKHKVFSVPEVVEKTREERTTTKGSVLIYTMMTVKYTFFAEDGSSVTAIVSGEGMDSGDKSANKALSVAHKYALAQIFAVPTADMTDPETESHEIRGKPKPVPPGEWEFLRDDLFAYLQTSENIVGKDNADKLREIAKKHEGDAAWFKRALEATIAEVKRQEAFLAANTKAAEAKPENPMAGKVAALQAAAVESGKVPAAERQGEMGI